MEQTIITPDVLKGALWPTHYDLPYCIPRNRYMSCVIERNYAYLTFRRKTVALDSKKQFDPLFGNMFPDARILVEYMVGEEPEWVVVVEDAIFFLSIDYSGDSSATQASLHTAASTRHKATQLQKQILDALPAPDTGSDKIAITFQYAAEEGAGEMQRSIAAPGWVTDGIRDNYTPEVQKHIDALTRRQLTPDAGQLMIWSGLPGTGKSYALRALARSIQQWCRVHYVIDPDTLLGGNSTYLVKTLLGSREHGDDGKWKLLVLEDAGDLIAADALTAERQAVGRLLNIVDGVLGQGLKIFVLVTTNEELGRLHPAIIRPGRCLSKLSFPPLPYDQSVAWLKSHDGPVGGLERRAHTLAELYARLAGRPYEKPDTENVGFR